MQTNNENKSLDDKINNLIEFFKSIRGVFIALVSALLAQFTHSVIAYGILDSIINNPQILKHEEINSYYYIWYYFSGILFSISASLAIIIFTLRGKKNEAIFFLVVDIFINMIYSRIDNLLDNYYILGSIIFLNIVLPYIIWRYANEVETSTDITNINDLKQLQDTVKTLEANLNNKIDKNKDIIVSVKGKSTGIYEDFNMKIK